MTVYHRPIVQAGCARPKDALTMAGGDCWFTHIECLRRDAPPEIIAADHAPIDVLTRLTQPRADILGLSFDQPRLMGILNVTPDSFSDGGNFSSAGRALSHAKAMIAAGVDIIDVGGESTRPGAVTVDPAAEIARVVPAITAVRAESATPISIDTRKTDVAHAAVQAGAGLVNDVSGFTYDGALTGYCRRHDLPVCVMHAQGDPETMHENPRYDDVLLDVYDFLAGQVAMLTQAGISKDRIIVDPGIGFGKTQDHNLALLHRISLFHAIGVPVLLGASRKGFIGRIGNQPDKAARAPGTIAVTLHALGQGVQIHRVHDVAEHRQALRLWQAVQHQGQG